MRPDEQPITTAIGATVVGCLIACLALIALGGWDWFSKFLESSAPAWVQAVGSVAAIGAAVWLGRRGEMQARAGAMNHYILFKAGLYDALTSAARVADEKSFEGLRYLLAELDDVRHLGQSVKLDALPPREALACTRFRVLAARAASYSGSSFAPNGTLYIQWRDLYLDFQKMVAHFVGIDEAGDADGA